MDLNLVRKFEGLSNQKQWKHTRWIPLVVLLLTLLGWELIARLTQLPAFILPSPLLVAERFIRALGDGSLARHTAITLFEVLLGW